MNGTNQSLLSLVSTLLLAIGTCTSSTGCVESSKWLAGYSNPSSKVSYHWLTGFRAETGADFEGTLVGTYNPETKELSINLAVNSDPTTVIAAEGERADHLVRLHELVNERHRIVGENFQAFGTMLAIAAAGGGDAVATVIDAAAPILKGSAIGLDIAGLGTINANLGAADPTPPPE